MSKFIPLLFAGAGAAATAVGGAYLIKNSGSGSSDQVLRNDEVEEGNSPEKNSPALEFDTLQKFKNGKGGGCVQDLFGQSPEIDFNVAEGTNPSESNFFGVVPTDTADNTKSCLVINWKKTLGGVQDDN